MTKLRRFSADCRGGTAFELAMIISIVSVVAVTGLQQVSDDLRGHLDRAGAARAGPPPPE